MGAACTPKSSQLGSSDVLSDGGWDEGTWTRRRRNESDPCNPMARFNQRAISPSVEQVFPFPYQEKALSPFVS